MSDLRRFPGLFLLVILFSLNVVPAAGQILFGQKASAGLDVISTSWKLKTDQEQVSIHQWAFPVTGFYPLKENMEARVFLAQSMTSVTQLGQDFNLNGLTDLRMQMNHSFSRDRLLFGAGLNLPVGHKNLSLEEEWVVMKYLSQSFLSFPIRQLGEGFGLNLLAGGVTEYREFRLGATATLDLKGPYQAYQSEPEYNPGNTIALTLGVQREVGSLLWNGDATLSASGEDKQGDESIFKRGNLLAFHLGVMGARPVQNYHADLTFRLRGRNQIFDPGGVLVQQLKVYGNEFILAGGLERRAGDKWRFGPALELRLIAANEFGLGKSTVATIGAHATRTMTESIDLRLALNFFTGSTNDGDIDLSGLQAWLAANGTF